MSTPPRPTKADRKAQARADREHQEQAADAKAARTRRLLQLLGVLALAAVVVVVAIVASSSGGGNDQAAKRTSAAQRGSTIAGQKEANALYAGLPQKGILLGSASAPVRLVSFVDMQCPFCREFELQSLPTLVQKYVRTGKVRMELRTLSFLGPDSVTAGHAVAAAAAQNKAWTFSDILFINQGTENKGWVTQPLLDKAYAAAGVDVARAKAFAASPAAQAPLGAANSYAGRLGVDSTPTILVGKRGGALKKVGVDPTDTAGYEKAIDALLGGAGA